MNLHLDQKIIIVTGGANGIGEGIVKTLAIENAVPVIIGRYEEDNLKTLASIDNKGFQLVAEITKPLECENAIKQVVAKFNRIDGLVNNVGVNDPIGLENGSYNQFVASLHKNLVHNYLMVHYALPWLKISKGPIVTIGSKTAETGQGNTSGYAASSGGGNALTREWAVELLKYGIRVNELVVAECYTPLYEKRIPTFEYQGEKLQSITNKAPLDKRMTTADEIANMVAFLLSDRASHTTGQLIYVERGYVHLDRNLTTLKL